MNSDAQTVSVYEYDENQGKSLENRVTNFENLLDSMGLPSVNVIASVEERENIMHMLPDLMAKISVEKKRDATYLSRFVAGSIIGLFDASVNYLWNEVVINLRQKAIYYGLDTFFDNAVGTRFRSEYKNEEDLSGIKDIVLLDTCKKMELISDIVYKKLRHILDMRNQIGASHPNEYSINSYELLGWLQTCVKEVIDDRPSQAAIKVNSMMQNLKTRIEPLDEVTIKSIENAVRELSTGMTGNLLTSLFGLYIADSTSNEVRNNILVLSKVVWKYCRDETKYSLGEKKELYRNNLDKVKEELTKTFFENCDGLSYLSVTERSLQISTLCDELRNAHYGWDNYYNEPPIAKDIMKYINVASDIPISCVEKLIDSFLDCRIGREVKYCSGVSPGAKLSYDSFFKILSKEQIIIVLSLITTKSKYIQKTNGVCANNIREILEIIKSPLLGDRMNEIINYMLKFLQKGLITKIYNEKGFNDLCKGIISK